MKNGLSREDSVAIVKSIDLIGVTMCLDLDGTPTPRNVREDIVSMLGVIRTQIAMSYGLNIDPSECLDAVFGAKDNLPSPAEVADAILRDLDNP
jgi:hypothetical protein